MVVMKKIINGNDEDDIDHGELFGDNLSSGKPGIFFVSKHLQRVSSAEEDQDHQESCQESLFIRYSEYSYIYNIHRYSRYSECSSPEHFVNSFAAAENKVVVDINLKTEKYIWTFT